MQFLNKILEDGERPICRSHLHVIYLVSGLMWFLGLAAIGWIADYNLWVHWGAYVPQYEINTPYFKFALAPGWIGGLFSAGGAFIFLSEWLRFVSTSIVLTTRRMLYKRGFIKIKVDATDIVDILGVHVDQGWLGQFFGFGKIHLDCRFIEDVYIPYVKNPYGIMKSLNKVKSSMQAHHVTPVELEEGEQRPPTQTLIQISGSNPVYIVDKVPDDVRTPLTQLPKSLADNMLSTFRRKA